MVTNMVEQGTKNQKEADRLKKIDFKMISFTLAGKDYGIDILKVKEIRKAGNFTKVPNTPVYVRGVDNLRGDIIPIIDLRIMLNLPAETKDQGTLENIIILRLDELILGIVVDSIEKVVGIASESIQPPHPIFGDINIKYINGVVENEGRLYIILDVDRLFVQKEVPKEEVKENHPASVAVAPVAETAVPDHFVEDRSQKNLDMQFISENLATFGSFYVTELNRAWVASRLESWKETRSQKGLDFQFTVKDDAEEFLREFYSPFSGRLWPQSYVTELATYLEADSGSYMVWNPGCAKGHETYSLALLLESHLGAKNYKIWANDSDLLNISTAPSLILDDDEVSEEYKKFTVKAKSGIQFSTELKSHILFEFHDINNMNPFGEVNLIVSRDLLSFLKPDEQEKILAEFAEKIKAGGYLVLGKNERVLPSGDWALVTQDNWSIYRRL